MSTSKRSPVADSYLYLPSRAGRVTLEEVERRQKAPFRLTWGVGSLDEYLIPFAPGDLVTVLGRPGHGKTSAMVHLVRHFNDTLSMASATGHVLYATWEVLVEEFEAIRLAHISGSTLEDIGRGRADTVKLKRAIATTISERLAVFGRSMRTDTGVPTLDDLRQVLQYMQDEGRPAEVLLLDYLQRIPASSGSDDRSYRVSENLERCKDIALEFRIPVVVGVQAKRDVDGYSGIRFPGLNDGQWSSNIEQTSDKVIGVTRPILYLDEHSIIQKGEEHYIVNERLMGLRVAKQRWGRSGGSFMLEMNPRTAELSALDPVDPIF